MWCFIGTGEKERNNLMKFNLSDSEKRELLNAYSVPIIDNDTNYWFVRTSAGERFEDFYFGQYIAIGWDKLNDLEALKYSTKEQVKDSVAKLYRDDDSRPGNTAAQILKFVNEVKVGDYILIPNASCERIAIGLITSDVYLYQPTEQDKFNELLDGVEINFLKRRNVRWITSKPLRRFELDPMLIPIIYSYGTIVDANPYSQFINRSIYNMYYKNGELHAIFHMTRSEDISAYYFNKFIGSIFETQKLCSSITDTDYAPDDFIIKASFNSAGPVEMITAAISAMLVLSSIALFINGADMKFKYNIFGLFKGEFKVVSSGLLDKIKDFNTIEAQHNKTLDKINDDLLKAKKNLEIRGKNILKKENPSPDNQS